MVLCASMSTHLTDLELLAFGGLVRLLVRLDGQITAEERQAIEQIGPEMSASPPQLDAPYRDGPSEEDDRVDRFWNMMDQAAKVFPDDEAVRQAALGVTRQEARQDIYDALYELAACDTISKPEWSLLDWLTSNWEIRSR